ncbi:GIY-YIG nuclease family protein [Arthrobacter sp. KBS0703]|uniref:GIY-YIG nuclease family protein n=1 Tax=Arthrobacter sp. KBS0703 TaxID=1955698 RepID=UPI0009CB2863|nr:GIY-YIG nuclease family protein [Arthrobacter sp. KBS0703]TSE15049.1 GIY-YIG nuclease family protein [Arthrobacter sp. KBS0703]
MAARLPGTPPVEHFGELIRPGKYGHCLTREMYALVNKKSSTRIPEHIMTDELRAYLAPHYEDAELTIRTDEFCRRHREMALENFDLNMAFFAQIPQESFDEALGEMLRKNKRLRPVTDLKTLDGEWGVYVLVLDEYRQAYIGQSSWDMRKRIKAHWTGTKQFDRLLWGGVEESVMSIDSFRALDTTRIFAARTINYDAMEARLVRSVPPDYLLNRIGGGAVTGLRGMFISAEMKRRGLVPAEAPGID